MKEIVISGKRKKIELITLLVCFVLANICNVYAIIEYKTPWIELFTSLGFVVVATVVFYAIWTFLRLIYFGIKSISRSKK